MPKRIERQEAAYRAALSYLTGRMRSEAQVRSYLREHGAESNWVDDTIERLKELKILDDEVVMEAVLRDAARTGHGTLYVAKKLRDRGLPLAALSEYDELPVCKEMARRLRAGEAEMELPTMMRRLQSRGFYEATIRKVVTSLSSDA